MQDRVSNTGDDKDKEEADQEEGRKKEDQGGKEREMADGE